MISKIFQLIFFLLILGPLNIQAANTSEGKTIYERNCAMCHGNNGISNMANAPSFKRGEGIFKSDYSLRAHIKKGKNACPAFVGIIQEKQIYNVIAYLRTFYR